MLRVRYAVGMADTLTHTPDAGTFVRAALLEVGQDGVAPYIRSNRGGCPAFYWGGMDRHPTLKEVDAVLRAFDLWYRAFDPDVPEGAWRGRYPGDADRWLGVIQTCEGLI